MSDRPSPQQTAEAYAKARELREELERESTALRNKLIGCENELKRHETLLMNQVGPNRRTRVFVVSQSVSVLVRHESGVELVPIGE